MQLVPPSSPSPLCHHLLLGFGAFAMGVENLLGIFARVLGVFFHPICATSGSECLFAPPWGTGLFWALLGGYRKLHLHLHLGRGEELEKPRALLQPPTPNLPSTPLGAKLYTRYMSPL